MKTVKNGAFQNGPYHFSADGQKRYQLWISPSIVSMSFIPTWKNLVNIFHKKELTFT